MPQKQQFLRGRGAQINPVSKYEKIVCDEQPLDWALQNAAWETPDLRTEYLETHPKTILNRVESADIPLILSAPTPLFPKSPSSGLSI